MKKGFMISKLTELKVLSYVLVWMCTKKEEHYLCLVFIIWQHFHTLLLRVCSMLVDILGKMFSLVFYGGGGWDTVKLLNKIKLLKYMVLLRCWNILWGFKTGVRVYGGLLICLWNISPPSPFIFHGRKILIHVSWKVIWKPQSSLNPYRLMLEVRYRTGWSLCRSAGRLLHNWLVLMQQYRQTPELLSGRLSSNNEATLSMDICKYNFQVRIAENSYHIISFTKITF